jgi:hypothetical protein
MSVAMGELRPFIEPCSTPHSASRLTRDGGTGLAAEAVAPVDPPILTFRRY